MRRDRRRWAARCAGSRSATASPARATSPAATAATAAPAAGTCAATPSGVGVNRQGCFAEYLVLPAVNVFKLPDDIPDEIASILDPLGNADHTALSFDLVGEDVLITGAGPIGIMAAAIAATSARATSSITDVNDYRLDLARKMGATRAVNVAKQTA